MLIFTCPVDGIEIVSVGNTASSGTLFLMSTEIWYNLWDAIAGASPPHSNQII